MKKSAALAGTIFLLLASAPGAASEQRPALPPTPVDFDSFLAGLVSGVVTFNLNDAPVTLVVEERDIYVEDKTIWGRDGEGNWIATGEYTARTFFGSVLGHTESSVILTVDPPVRFIIGTITYDGFRHTVKSEALELGVDLVFIDSQPGAPPPHSPLLAGAGTDQVTAIVNFLPDYSWYAYYNTGWSATISNAFAQGAPSATQGPWAAHGVFLIHRIFAWNYYADGHSSCTDFFFGGLPNKINEIYQPPYPPGFTPQPDDFWQGLIRKTEFSCFGQGAGWVNNYYDPCWCNAWDQWDIVPLGTVEARSFVNAKGGNGYNVDTPHDLGIVMHAELTHVAGQEDHPLEPRRCLQTFLGVCTKYEWNLMASEAAGGEPPARRGFWNVDVTNHRLGREGTPQMS